MAKDIKNEGRAEAETTVVRGGLEQAIRQRARLLIDAIVEEEVEHALGAAPSVRVGAARAGYRHGTRDRTLTTSLGPTTFAMPRARVVTPEGGTAEWRSELVPRYQRISTPQRPHDSHVERRERQLHSGFSSSMNRCQEGL